MASGSVTQVGKISRGLSFFLLGLLMFIGTATQLVFKGMNRCEINGQGFNHPFMQSFLMFIGEALCFPMFIYYKRRFRARYEAEIQLAKSEGKITECPWGKIAIPTSCDEVASTLSFFALNLMPVSIYSMLRGGTLLIVALFSKIFLKATYNNQKVFGMALVTFGVTIVGYGSFAHSQKQDGENLPLGMLLILLSMFVQSAQVVIEQKMFSDFELNPFEMVGVEGFWGMLISSYVALIANSIPCPGNFDCGGAHMENLSGPTGFFKQLFTFKGEPGLQTNQPNLFILVILSILCINILNATGMAITKFDSALTRQVAGVTYPFFLWLICLAIGWENFFWEQLLGYLILAGGSVIYNQIILIPQLQPPKSHDEIIDSEAYTSDAGNSLVAVEKEDDRR